MTCRACFLVRVREVDGVSGRRHLLPCKCLVGVLVAVPVVVYPCARAFCVNRCARVGSTSGGVCGCVSVRAVDVASTPKSRARFVLSPAFHFFFVFALERDFYLLSEVRRRVL